MNDFERIAAAIRFLDQHRATQPRLSELAEAAGLSEFHFHRLFHRWAGITPKDFLQCLTVEHAKQRLRDSMSVLEAALESGLSGFEDGSFDYVILSQTLQAIRHTERVVNEMLRVGREGIVTFPNFGYWRPRLQVFFGNMPVSKTLPYQWYDTPNIHLFTIDDFEKFCAGHGIRILERNVMADGRPLTWMPNLRGSLAVYRFDRA